MKRSDTIDRRGARRIEAAPQMRAASVAVSGVPMFVENDRESFVERRQHSRTGALTRLEDITYSVLREHEVANAAA